VNTQALSQATNAATSNSSTTPTNQLGPDSFMKLLIAQLQAQDPTNPLDPTTFMTQLVQFNMLDQISQIRNLIANGASVTGQSSQTSTPTQPVAQGN